MKRPFLLLILSIISLPVFGQWTTPSSNEVSTTKEVIAPVLRLSNELRIPNTFDTNDPSIGTFDNSPYGINFHKTQGVGFVFNGVNRMIIKPTGEVSAPVFLISNEVRVANSFIPTDPTIGTMDNSHYGINLDKTEGVGFAFNGAHKFIFRPNGDMITSGASPKLTIRGTGTGNYQGGGLILAADGVTTGNKHVSTHFLTHRGTDGTASIEMQRRDSQNGYNGSALFYKDGYGWKFGVASNPTSSLTNALMINNLGKVGIGTTSPLTNLHVSTGTSGDAIFRLEADTDNDNEADNPLIQLRQDSGLVGINMGLNRRFLNGQRFNDF